MTVPVRVRRGLIGDAWLSPVGDVEPHLFAVLVTRARRRMVVVLSADPPPGGLAAAYLAQADGPPGRPPAGPVGPWAAAIAR